MGKGKGRQTQHQFINLLWWLLVQQPTRKHPGGMRWDDDKFSGSDFLLLSQTITTINNDIPLDPYFNFNLCETTNYIRPANNKFGNEFQLN